MAPHILIIDDEANQRLMLAEALRALDPSCVITTVDDSPAALEFASRVAPDLIITDYHMPQINGLELVTQLRLRGVLSRIILITAYSSPDLAAAAQQLAVDYYLTKPVPLQLLRKMTLAALDQG